MSLKKNIIFFCSKKAITTDKLISDLGLSANAIELPTPSDLIKISNYFGYSIDTLLKTEIQTVVNNKKIKLVVLDVDGTLTDGGMYFSEKGDQLKKYNTKDGLMIKEMSKKGILFGIISHSHYKNMVESRAQMLGIKYVYVGIEDKATILQNWLNELKITLNEVAYIGDDINDLDVLKKVGLSACPADSVEKIKSNVDIVLQKKGGEGCVREFCDLIFND